MGKPWASLDSVVMETGEAFSVSRLVAEMADADEETTLLIMGMPFMQTWKGPEEGDVSALWFLNGLLASYPADLKMFLSQPALLSGVTDDQAMNIVFLFLETRDREAATAIRGLPWVQDGMQHQEEWTLQELSLLYLRSPDVFWAYIQLHGDVGGDLGIHASIVESLARIAAMDEEIALRVVAMPFLETQDSEDYETLLHLRQMSADKLQTVLSHPELQEGITDDNLIRVWLLRLGPEAEAAIEAIPWIRDGIAPPFENQNVTLTHRNFETIERRVVLQLITIGRADSHALVLLARKPWMQSRLNTQEVDVIHKLADIAQRFRSAMGKVLEGSFLESIDGTDARILGIIIELMRSDMDSARKLMSHPALANGIADDDRGQVALLALEEVNPRGARAIRALPWVEDGVELSEQTSILLLLRMAWESPLAFEELISARRSWIEDGFTEEEMFVVGWLTALSSRATGVGHEADTIRVIRMPFLDEVDQLDIRAIEGLVQVVAVGQYSLSHLLSHPSLAGGITSDLAKVIAVMVAVSTNQREILDALLDPNRVAIEEREINLPLAGEVLLTVTRIEHGFSEAMDWLEHAVRSQEEFMGEAFPTSYIGLLVADASRYGGSSASIGIVTVDPGTSQEILFHEMAHSYWYGSSTWVREGAAELLKEVSLGDVRPPRANECSLTDSLAELDRLRLELGSDEIYWSGCSYTLGRSLFAELYRDLGSDAFRKGFRSLNLKVREGEHEDECQGLERAVCLLEAAFVDEGDSHTAPIAEAIIERRYHGVRTN